MKIKKESKESLFWWEASKCHSAEGEERRESYRTVGLKRERRGKEEDRIKAKSNVLPKKSGTE